MSGTDHPPSTTNPMSLRRRVLALTARHQPGRGRAHRPRRRHEPRRRRQNRRRRRRLRRRDRAATLERIASVAQAVAPPTTTSTTTTTPPPAPTTTTTAPPAPPAVQPVASGTGYNDPSNPAAWDRLAQCESGGNWAANTGNGYYGGIQFSVGSWQGVGGSGRPDQASRETQIAMGQRLWNQGGWQHWPACTLKLGYR